MDCWAGKPEAGEVVAGLARELWFVAGERAVVDVWGAGESEDASGGRVAVASGFTCWVAAGVSTNIIDGPGASSLATAVRGTGLDVNFGRDSGSRIGGGAGEEEEIWDVDS